MPEVKQKSSIFRRAIVAAVIGLITFVGFLVVVMVSPDPNEPTYQDKKLSEWIFEYGQATSSTNRESAKEAIQAMGTNALSLMLYWISPDHLPLDSPRGVLSALADATDIRLLHSIKSLFSYDSELNLAYGSAVAFEALGPMARPAINDLCRLIEGPNEFLAWIALMNVGRDGLPAISNYLTNSNYELREKCITHLFFMDDDIAKDVYPLLVLNLSVTNDQVVAESIGYLSDSGALPDQVVPLLLKFTKDDNSALRYQATDALRKYQVSTPEVLSALSNVLNDAEPIVRLGATNAIQVLLKEKTDEDVLIRILDQTSGSVFKLRD